MAATREGPPPDLLIFQLDDRRFGLPIDDVQELVRSVDQAHGDGLSDRFEGAIDLRGRIVPVLALRRRLGLPPREVRPTDQLIIGRSGGRTIALRVDCALELASLERDDDDADGDGVVEGLARHPGLGVVPVLSLAALLGRAPARVRSER